MFHQVKALVKLSLQAEFAVEVMMGGVSVTAGGKELVVRGRGESRREQVGVKRKKASG